MLSNIYFVLLAISVGLVFGDTQIGYCPPIDYINPCSCINNFISCTGNHFSIDLEAVFERLSQNLESGQKYFLGFQLSNTAITELKANTFKDIHFEEIYIEKELSLKRIDANAFAGTNLVTKTLHIDSNPKLSQSSDNSLYSAVNTFVNIESLYLLRNNITEIPDYAFNRLSYLANIKFNGKALFKIGWQAFQYLNALKELEIKETSIGYIPYNAFQFIQNSDNDLKIDLMDNPLLTPNSFTKYSLSSMRRPAQLYMGLSEKIPLVENFQHLSMSPFFYFLNDSPKNTINMTGRTLDCDDCENFWLTEKTVDYQSRIQTLKCSNGKPFNDSSNFVGCK